MRPALLVWLICFPRDLKAFFPTLRQDKPSCIRSVTETRVVVPLTIVRVPRFATNESRAGCSAIWRKLRIHTLSFSLSVLGIPSLNIWSVSHGKVRFTRYHFLRTVWPPTFVREVPEAIHCALPKECRLRHVQRCFLFLFKMDFTSLPIKTQVVKRKGRRVFLPQGTTCYSSGRPEKINHVFGDCSDAIVIWFFWGLQRLHKLPGPLSCLKPIKTLREIRWRWSRYAGTIYLNWNEQLLLQAWSIDSGLIAACWLVFH